MPTFTVVQKMMIMFINVGTIFAIVPFKMALTVIVVQGVLGFCLGVSLALLGLVKPGQ